MYAVIKTGGKQYRVEPGDTLKVESLGVEEGDTVNIEEILMVGNGDEIKIGSPLVSDAEVVAKVLSHGRGKKVKIIKFKRRKHYRRQMGHRQNFTEIEIVSVNGVSAVGSNKADSTGSAGAKGKSAASDAAASPSAGVGDTSVAVSSSTENSGADQNLGAVGGAGSNTTADKGSVSDASNASAASDDTAPLPELKFLDAPNGDPDDLKKILGIGSVLEEKLNGMGVYHYSQVAAFTEEDIANINTHLNFPGRIERDEWIPQAKELMQGGEGRTLKYLDAPEGEPDDLKQILGVGPVLEGRLNELGIYHFWQIAKFEQRDIDLVNDAMAFPGRIERDEWIEQAKDLAAGGEPR